MIMSQNIICYGEVLWDVFPSGLKKIGGAPLNVALRLKTMGCDSGLITKVGDDHLGKELIDYVAAQELPIETFQKDKTYKTGEVLVHLDASGTASYTISKDVAWDYIQLTENIKNKVSEADAFIFGTLAARSEVSRVTLMALLDVAKFRVLDVNLRPPHYTKEILEIVLQKADFIKMNDEELFEIVNLFGFESRDEKQCILHVVEKFETKQICVTRGSKGAILYDSGNFYHHSGYKVKVVDTVGAGDTFLATLLTQILQGQNPDTALDYASALGAMVAGSEGANPNFTKQEITAFMQS